MSPRVVGVTWSDGVSPAALAEALAEEALTVAVLAALLEEPERREKAEAALRAHVAGDTAKA